MSAASHPARGAWIEILLDDSHVQALLSHPARGAWIEIQFDDRNRKVIDSRTPQGVRGLKSGYEPCKGAGGRSHPARGAWIEI